MKPRAQALLGLAILALYFCREAVFGGRVFYARDLHLQWFGQVESFVRTLHSGSLPLWDPWVSFGQPMLANANAQVLYPLTWLNLVMRPWTYYTIYFMAHLLLAGLGTWSLARRLGAKSGGALLASLVWTCSGPLLSLGNAWNHLAGAAWMPWILDATLRAMDAPSPRRALAWGATVAAAVLAGSPDFAVLAGAFSAALVGVRLVSLATGAERLRRLWTTATAALFALGLSAAQLLPSADLASRSERWTQSVQERTYWSLHPASLAQTIVPVSWAELSLTPSWSEALFEGREPYLLSVFVGLPAVVLGLVAIERRRGRGEGVLAVSLVVATLLALGRHAVFYPAAVALIPFLGIVRFPSKILVLAVFALALLSGLGYDALRGEASRRTPRLASAVALLLTLAALASAIVASRTGQPALQPLTSALWVTAATGLACFALLVLAPRQPAAAVGLAALAVAPAAWMHRSLNPTAPLRFFTARPEVVDTLDQREGRRLFVDDYQALHGRSRERLGREAPYLVAGVPASAPWLQALGQRLYLLPPVGAAYGIRDSYGRDLLGIQPTPLARLNSLALRSEGTPAFARLLQLGAVSQVLALHDPGSDLPLERRFPGPFVDDMRLHRVPGSLPRALVVSGARVAERPVEALLDPEFEANREVVLSQGVSRAPDAGFQGSARILEDKPDHLRIATSGGSPGWLVVIDTHDPGWRATVDGRQTDVVPANVAFRGVAVPAGSHVVELRYRPTSVLWGAGVCLVTVVASLVVVRRKP